MKTVQEKSICDLRMSSRLHNILIYHSIKSLGDLSSMSDEDLLRLRGLGRGLLREVKEILDENGLRLRSALDKVPDTSRARINVNNSFVIECNIWDAREISYNVERLFRSYPDMKIEDICKSAISWSRGAHFYLYDFNILKIAS